MSRYIEDAGLANWFGYHPPTSKDIANGHDFVRRECRELAGMLNKILPEGPEKTLALRKIREAAMWGNAAIACRQEVGERPCVARIAWALPTTVTPEPETVYVNVLHDERTAAELARQLDEAVSQAAAEVFGDITDAQHERFADAINAAIAKTNDARDTFDQTDRWPVHEPCGKPVNGNPLSLTISNQCLLCAGHDGACTADSAEADRLGRCATAPPGETLQS